LNAITAPLKKDNGLALERLQFCADLLDRERDEKQVEDSELVQLTKDVTDLVKQTRESEIDAELKLYILHQLGTLSDAIEEYRMFGIGALSKAANGVMGSMILDLDEPKRREWFEGPIGPKFWKLFLRFAAIATTAEAVLQIGERFQKLLN
jgi:hypothetical protein